LLSADSKLQFSSGGPDKRREWIVEQVPQTRFDNVMPKYTIKNKATGAYLSLSTSSGASSGRLTSALAGVEEGSDPKLINAQWTINVVSDGVNIHSALDNQDIHQTAGGGSGEDEDDWILEGQGRRGHSVKKQWEVASQLPVFPGKSQIRWGELCRISACGDEKYYETERERQRHWGKLDVDERKKTVVENLVPQGICAWDVDLIKDFVNNPEVVQELHSSNKYECPSCSLEAFATSLSKAVHEECFDSCATHLDELVEGLPCADHETSPANWSQVFEQVVQGDVQCGTLPPDTLMELAEYRMVRKCKTWHAPSLLWVMNDRGLDIEASQHAVCKVPKYNKAFSTSSEDIYQKGTCPEGTACNCPEDWNTDQPSLAERRDQRFSMMFITPGSAIIPVIFNYYKAKIVVKWMVKAILYVATGHHTLPLKLIKFVLDLGWHVEKGWGLMRKVQAKEHKWKCAYTAACWAVRPERRRSARGRSCRVSDGAKAGGSPVWFLPPPLFKVQRKFLKCSLKPCEEGEVSAQQVGIGGKRGKNIYNCQPLIWEDMGEGQQSSLVTALAQSGVGAEYDLIEVGS